VYRKIICFILSLVLFSCELYFPHIKPSKMVSEFFRMSTNEQIKHFNDYNLDEQYELFIFGNQVVHPPAIYLADLLAEQGPGIIPFLTAKLQATQDEITIRDIMTVFEYMAQRKVYDFTQDTELITLMEQRVNKMDGLWKGTALEMLSNIRSMR